MSEIKNLNPSEIIYPESMNESEIIKSLLLDSTPDHLIQALTVGVVTSKTDEVPASI